MITRTGDRHEGILQAGIDVAAAPALGLQLGYRAAGSQSALAEDVLRKTEWPLSQRLRSMSLSWRAPLGSRPTVGSSRKRISGSCTKAEHRASFWRIPRE